MNLDKTKPTITYLSELDHFLERTNISPDKVCIVGSGVLADHGLRKNRDIDIVVDPFERHLVDKTKKPSNLQVAVEKYSWLGINDHELINDEKHHYLSSGYKISKPEIELDFKLRRRRQKDRRDVKLLGDHFLHSDDYKWNWEIFNFEYYPDNINKYKLPVWREERTQGKLSLIYDFIDIWFDKGALNAFKATSQFLQDRTPYIRSQTNRAGHDSSITRVDSKTIYFILYPTARKVWDPIINSLNNELGVISTEVLNIGEDIDDFVNELYRNQDKVAIIEYKAHKIKEDGSDVCVVKTQCPIDKNGDIHKNFLQSFKNPIRKEFYPYVPNDAYGQILHGPINNHENRIIKNAVKEYKSIRDK